MRRFLATLSALVFSLLFVSPALSSVYVKADAYDPFTQACNGAPSDATACQQDGTKNPVSGQDGIIFKAINIFSFIIGAASVIMIIFGGIKYVTSSGGRGADGKGGGVVSAKNTILYAVIGVVVFLLSRGIIAFVINKL